MKELDNLHYDFREIDGYNKPFNIIISPREAGKTTAAWVKKVYRPWIKSHKPWLYLVRNANEITESLISGIETPISKFNDPIQLIYARQDLESGICDIGIPCRKTEGSILTPRGEASYRRRAFWQRRNFALPSHPDLRRPAS